MIVHTGSTFGAIGLISILSLKIFSYLSIILHMGGFPTIKIERNERQAIASGFDYHLTFLRSLSLPENFAVHWELP